MPQKRAVDRGGLGGSKRSRSDSEQNLSEAAPVPGSIIKIELQNFMCHTYFEVELSPTVNFIIGRNGSGKSAILMALVIGLGGKSSATNRAPNMTEFIKQGSSWGQVTITISNSNKTTAEAWQYDTYGEFVMVERRITKKGSTYKLKNCDGKVISTKKNDLILLLDNYNIQVNNPVSILNQEMAKKFLASTDPSSKYNFFMKSTHLEQMILDYQQVNERLDMIKGTVSKKEETIPDVKAQVRHLKNQYDEITELRDLGRKVSQLKDELIWSKVKEIEDELIPIERSVDKINDHHLPKIEKEISKAQERFDLTDSDVKAIEAEIQEDMKKYGNLESEQSSLRQLAYAKKRELNEVQRKIKTTRNSIKDIEKDRERLRMRISEIENSNEARNVEEERAARNVELEECRENQKQLTQKMTTTSSEMESLERSLSSMSEDLNRIREDIDQTEGQIRKQTEMLRTHQEAKKNRVSVFGNYMPELLKRIEDAYRNNRFHRKPRGPFGLHIKVKDPKWAPVIELAIGGFCRNFVIHDGHDKAVLQELFRKSCPNPRDHPNMTMMKFRDTFYDVSEQKPQTGGHPTIYDMLEISDNMISNALVEVARIEQSLLIESSEEARMLIIGHAPRNVCNAWTLAGDDIKGRGAYSNNLNRNNRNYFRDDPSKVIEEINFKLRELREQASMQRHNKSSLEKRVNDLRGSYKTEKKKQEMTKKELENIRRRILDLGNVEETPMMDATALEDELRQLGDQIHSIQEEVKELGEKEGQLKGEHQEAQKRHTDSVERDSHITTRLEELKNKMHEGQRLHSQKLENLEQAKRKKKELNSEKKKFVTELNDKKKEIEDAKGMAVQRCERVESRRPPKDLEQQIRNMENRIEKGLRSTVSVDDITRRFQEANIKFVEIKTTISQMKKFCRDLQKVMVEREDGYYRFRQEISKRINYFFVMNLSQRGYTGKLEVDHEGRQLLMHLNVDTSGATKDTQDIRSLSGGERSYTTVCLLCSLWNLMETPFRCLDEFDVFMDLLNRKITMKLLMEHAEQEHKSNCPKQYIFFTPQDMSGFSTKFKNVKILQLEAPERNGQD